MSDLDRNLDGLIWELGEACHRIFRDAAGATSRSAVVSSVGAERQVEEEARGGLAFRERTVLNKVDFLLWSNNCIDDIQDGEWVQHVIVFEENKNKKEWTRGSDQVGNAGILVGRIKVAGELRAEIGVAVLECEIPEEEEGEIKILNAEFFDDESVVIVYELGGESKPGFCCLLDLRLMMANRIYWYYKLRGSGI